MLAPVINVDSENSAGGCFMSEAFHLNRTTGELLEALSKTDCIHSYIKMHKDSFIGVSVSDKLSNLVVEKGATKASVIKRAEVNGIYGYQIFSGERKPSRDTLLCLCVGLALNVEESQQLLKLAGYASLYPKHARDCIILHGINNSSSVSEINECLYNYDMPTL
jgi:hypothetical protein